MCVCDLNGADMWRQEKATDKRHAGESSNEAMGANVFVCVFSAFFFLNKTTIRPESAPLAPASVSV